MEREILFETAKNAIGFDASASWDLPHYAKVIPL